jgi:hypothetical protein
VQKLSNAVTVVARRFQAHLHAPTPFLQKAGQFDKALPIIAKLGVFSSLTVDHPYIQAGFAHIQPHIHAHLSLLLVAPAPCR